MLPWPQSFDANEWFILITLLIGYVCVALLPKRYPNAVATLIALFCVSVAIILDHSIATPPLDLYDVNDFKKYELMDVITYFMYSPYALICAYLYDRLRPQRLFLAAYIVGWSALATLFEWIASLCHVFTYTHWSFLSSFCVYLIATPAQLAFFRYTMRYFDQHREMTE
ncbi:hypothetical protein JI721_10200 [Alicyclobacillus cycloheptanicus]|uniref:Uncharacterized protein n=1 Tax=Alicyclobacillus cycloheptanicus TaxID=1457 RepID=A0ABT9XN47_9BACL|nr:hypothetical protein [Alicyclobacillus cycloheptanicus]MDQ0191555.1 hypothetical protein [Alicyclobacillus cycloheptanicus]WDM00123.1 hypothetical protein JI721_10200 [Alicyclobacillus cycloheptanicus]